MTVHLVTSLAKREFRPSALTSTSTMRSICVLALLVMAATQALAARQAPLDADSIDRSVAETDVGGDIECAATHSFPRRTNRGD